MEPLDPDQIRSSIRNCSKGERARLALPRLQDVDWAVRDVLGWYDPKAPLKAYVVVSDEAGTAGVALRAPRSLVRRTAQCFLCHVVHPKGVGLFVASLCGPAGAKGNTVGVYACGDLDCSTHLRAELRPSRTLPDPEPVLAQRRADLRRRARAFIAQVERG